MAGGLKEILGNTLFGKIAKNVTNATKSGTAKKVSGTPGPPGRVILPVSDDIGYEVVGNFRYGRGLMVDRTGKISVRTIGDAGPNSGLQIYSNDRVGFGTGIWPAQMIAALDVKVETGGAGESTGLPAASTDLLPANEDADVPTAPGGKIDPLMVQVDTTYRGRTLAELTPGFTYNQTCACTMQRADNLLWLVQSGELFNLMKQYLYAGYKDVKGEHSVLVDFGPDVTVDMEPSDNILVGAYMLAHLVNSLGFEYGTYGYAIGGGASRSAKNRGAFNDKYSQWLANVFYIYEGIGGAKQKPVVDINGKTYHGGKRAKNLLAKAKETKKWDKDIASASAKHGVDPKLVKSVMAVESYFYPNAIGKKGARADGQRANGLMQILPDNIVAHAEKAGVKNAFTVNQGGLKLITVEATAPEGVIDNTYTGQEAPTYEGLLQELEAAAAGQNAQQHAVHKLFEDEISGKTQPVTSDPDTLKLMNQLDRTKPTE